MTLPIYSISIQGATVSAPSIKELEELFLLLPDLARVVSEMPVNAPLTLSAPNAARPYIKRATVALQAQETPSEQGGADYQSDDGEQGEHESALVDYAALWVASKLNVVRALQGTRCERFRSSADEIARNGQNKHVNARERLERANMLDEEGNLHSWAFLTSKEPSPFGSPCGISKQGGAIDPNGQTGVSFKGEGGLEDIVPID